MPELFFESVKDLGQVVRRRLAQCVKVQPLNTFGKGIANFRGTDTETTTRERRIIYIRINDRAMRIDTQARSGTDTAQTWRYQMVIYSTTADGGTKDRYLSMMSYCTRMQEFIDGLDFDTNTADVSATEVVS